MSRRVVLLACVVLAVSGAPRVGATTPQDALRVLVTNDDGVRAPGIDALVEALRKVPNVDVTVVAPLDDRSGTGDTTTFDPSTVTTERARTASERPAVAVRGYPADAVRWALGGGIAAHPDLVVSGINRGENLGASVAGSGTVGAARTAARAGIRALAVSQGAAAGPDYAAGARYAIEWVRDHRAELLARRGQPVPDVVAVDNLNVPTCVARRVRGLARVTVAKRAPEVPGCSLRSNSRGDDVTAFANGYATITSLPVTAVCTRFTAVPGPAPVLQDPALDEVSGVAASRAHPPALWVHNDSGGQPSVYAVAPDGSPLGAYAIDAARNVDWEDLAVGPGPQAGTSYLYVGDIGDNERTRDSVDVYRVAEPAPAPAGSGGTLTGAERFTLHYPRRPVDAESLLVDPVTGDLFVLDKRPAAEGVTTVYRAPKAALVDGADVTLRKAASFVLAPDAPDAPLGLPGSLATAADVSPDGSVVLVRTYRGVLAFARPAGESLAAAFAVDPCTAPATAEPQGEAVAFTADGVGYVTVGEGAHPPLNRFASRVS